MLNIFMFVLVGIALIQEGWHRRIAALMVALPFAAAHIIDSLGILHDGYYYLMVAFVDVASIVFLAHAKVMDRFVMALIDVCCCFFVAQLIGCVMYYCYVPSGAYDVICAILYVVLMGVLITRSEIFDGGYNSTIRDIVGIWSSIRPSRLLISPSKKEVRA